MKTRTPLKTYARLERRTPMERGDGLKAKRWGAKPAPKAANWRDDFLPEHVKPPKYTPFELSWFAFVRTMECVGARFGGCAGDMVAAHVTLSANEKGTSMKVPHGQTAPMCCKHHDDWDGRNGLKGNPWAGMSRDDRWALGATWIEDVKKAAIPGDNYEHALDLFNLGLGTIVPCATGLRDGWSWVPGDAEREAA